MARQSLIPSRVKNTGIDLVITGALIVGGLAALHFFNKQFGILDRFVAGGGALGNAIGKSVGVGLTGISTGLATGFLGTSQPSTGSTGQLGTTTEIAQQNLRDNLTIGGLLDPASPNYIGKAFSNLLPPAAGDTGSPSNTSTGASNTTSTATTTVKPGVSTKSTNPVPYSAAAQVEQRAVNVVRASSNVRTVAFGGYGTAKAQEDALQAALAQAKAKYPQYYGVTT